MKCRHSFVCLLLLMFSIFGCNQGKNKTPKVPSDNGKQVEKEGEITFQIKKVTGAQSSFVPLDQMIPASGIPYTATEKEINPEGRLVLKASAKDVTSFKAVIIAPEKDAPLKISGKIDLFDIVFKRVDNPTLVKVRFSHYAKGNTTNTIYKDVAFNILPEPKITKVEGKDVKLIIGIDYDLSDEALTFTTSPEKIGEMNAEAYMLQASKKITFANSSDASVATITDGKVHTLKQGETKIELLCNNEKKGELKIVVEDKKAPTRISCLTQDITLAEGESQDIVLIPTPIDASLNLSDWKDSTLSGEKIGKIEKKGQDEATYTITALKKGRTTFSAHSKYNKDVKISIILTVSDAKLEGISIDPPRISLGIGETKQLKIVARPDNASVAVTWKSNSPETVSVNESGQITALKNGNAIVTATSLSDATKTANCVVIVTKQIEKIELNHEVAELLFGDTLQLQATVTPSDAPQGISWHAESLGEEKIEDLLTITTAGLVTAKNKAGYAKIVATSDADNEKKAECYISIAKEKVYYVRASSTDVDMYTNSEKELTIEVWPSEAAGALEYDWEADDTLTIGDLEQEPYTNKYTCKIKSGAKEGTKKITFFAATNWEKKVEVTVKVNTPKAYYVNVRNKTIALTQTDAKMVATIEPPEAPQTVTWESQNPDICAIDANTGLLTPIAKGEAEIVATSTQVPTVKGRAKVKVEASITSFNIVSIEPASIYYGYGSEATITFETTPVGSFGGFVFETDNKDIEFIETADLNKYKIRVKNKNAKAAKVNFTCRSSAAPTLPAKTGEIEIKTIVPTTLTIENYHTYDGEDYDGIYLDETLKFQVKANDATPTPDKSVEWKLEEYKEGSSDSAPLEQIKLETSTFGRVEITLRGEKIHLIGKKFKVIATSTLDESIKAEKVITIYKNIAQIESVKCNMQEYTITSHETNNKLYNKGVSPQLKIKLEGDVLLQHMEFFVSSADSLVTDEDYKKGLNFRFTRLKESDGEYDETTNIITFNLKPNKNTEGNNTVFTVHPIDPKMSKSASFKVPSKSSYPMGYFSMTIWDEPTGIAVFKADDVSPGGFNISDKNDGGYESETLNYQATYKYVFDVRTTPEYANPNYLEYEVKKVSGNYLCIKQDSRSDEPDSITGKWRFKFYTNENNTWAAHDYAKFWFYIKVPNKNGEKQDLHKPIKNYLLIDSN